MSRRVCVVGAGRWGTNHIRTLEGLGCLAGIVESNGETLRRCREMHPQIASFDNIRDAAVEDFDGFTIATPAERHFELTKYLITRKKHVLVEKPLALTAADARRLERLARENGVNLMVGHLLLFHPAIREIKRLIGSGKVGKLQYLYSNRLNLGAVRTEENILWSFAPHDISIFQHLIERAPIGVESHGGAFLQPHIHDSTLTVLTYPDNVVGHIFVSWLHPFKEHRLVVIGSKGMFSFEDSSEKKDILFYEKGIDWIQGEPIKREGPTEIIPYERKPPLTAELEYFVEHLDGRPIEIADGHNGVEILEILERATKSLLSGGGTDAARAPGGGQDDFFVHPSSCVDDDVEIGAGTKIWHYSHVQTGARIGRSCTLGQNVSVGGNVKIGDFVKIQNNVSVYEGVELEDYVFCGPSMVFTNVKDPRCKYPQRGSEHYVRTLVRQGASIGANATILCGLTIGRHAFIAAGAVVTKDVADYALMVGGPARKAGWVCECGQVLPDSRGKVLCSRCALEYELHEGRLVPGMRGRAD
jgi:UDP-2-acetamido-3-amino-2,3-dideoxy-glucuronate N-acetyltransferase